MLNFLPAIAWRPPLPPVRAPRRPWRLLSTAPRPVLYYSDTYEHPLPPGHRFPMHKYRLVREALERDPSMTGVSFRRSPKATREEVTRVHTEEYFDRFCSGRLTADETRAVGFPWSSAGVARSLASTGGTVAATRALLRLPGMRVAGHVAGGTHRALRHVSSLTRERSVTLRPLICRPLIFSSSPP